MRELTRDLGNPASPVRQFLDERFGRGLKDVQRRFRESAPRPAVLSVPKGEANPGTVGGAADWLLRFMICPAPSVDLAFTGACFLGPGMMRAVTDLATLLGLESRPYSGIIFTELPDDDAIRETRGLRAPAGAAEFTGPAGGSGVDPDLLARACWALALATEARRSERALDKGPLAQFRSRTVTADDLLALAPPAGLSQLAEFRHAFQTTLIPQLAARTGRWVLGPTFPGSAMAGEADADLIAAGLLLDLKTTAKPALAMKDLWQVVAYALLDFSDRYHLDSVGIFKARYAQLATWGLGALLNELAGHPVSLAALREEFHQLLLAYQDAAGAAVPPGAQAGERPREDTPRETTPAPACEIPESPIRRIIRRIRTHPDRG